MKTKFKRHSRSVLSVVLAVCMLVSCLTVGIIASDAANVTEGDEELGATYYIWKAEGNSGNTASTYTCLGASPQSITATSGKNYYIAVSTSATSVTTGTVWLDGADFTDVSVSGHGVQGFDGYQAYRFSLSSATTLTVTYSSGSRIKVVGGGSSSSSCTTDHKMIVTGSQQLTNTSSWQNTWSGAGTRNQMTYNSAVGMYEIKYTNIAASASSSDYFRFRILDLTTKGDPDTSWETDKGFNQGSGAITDASNILQGTSKTTAGSDNTFQFSLSQKANITIYLDDSKLDTNTAIQIIVTPAVSTVTAGSCTGGTVKVNNAASASNIAYGGTVTLTATASDDYVFSKWDTNANLSYANANSATTTATVTGDATVTATFAKKSYTVSKGTGTGFTITAPASAQTKQWGTSVSVTAKTSSDLYYIDYLYYLNENTGAEQKLGTVSGSTSTPAAAADGAGSATSMTGTFNMPKNNVTVYAHVHEKTSNTITYGVTTDSPTGSGYVSVGKAHNTSASAYSTTQIDYTIDSGSKVIEGTYVNFGARAAAGYKFVGWFTSEDGSGSKISGAGTDYQKQTPSGKYFAKFVLATDPAYKNETGKVRLLFKKSDYSSKTYYAYTWYDTNTEMDGSWHGIKITDLNTITNGAGTEYYYRDYDRTTFKLIMNDSDSQSGDISFSAKGTYIVSFDGGTTGSAPAYSETTGGATTTYYPAKLYVTNSDLGYVNSSTNVSGTYLSNYFCARSSSVNVYARPTDTDNYKSSIRKVSGSTDTTSVIFYGTTYSSMTMNASATEATATVTFVPKDYYKVYFSAGAGGSISAKVGTTTITSGTAVKERSTVTFTATPASGYEIAGWTGAGTGTGATRTINSLTTDVSETNSNAVRVYFKKSKGTASAKTWFGYIRDTTATDKNPNDFTVTNAYVKNGRVYGYIDNLTYSSSEWYYIAAYSANASSTEDKYKKMYYRDNNAIDGFTDFTSDITGIYRCNWNDTYDSGSHTDYYIRFQVSSKVKGLIIDLGPDSGGDGNARPDKDGNVYKIIPVYNTDVSKVTVYAKDGTYRGDSDYDYMPTIADTVITNPATNGGVTNISSQTEFNTAVAQKGKAITVTTTIDSGTYNRDRFYVKGFSFNGITNEILTENSTGVYTTTYTIPADFEDDYLEITPIYFIRDSYLNTAANNCTAMTFYIENYDQKFQDTGWGNTLAVYPFYSTASSPVYSKANVFGGYPGLPVVNYGGRRFVQVPTKYKIAVDNESGSGYSVGTAATIKGITLSNYYWDKVHRDYCQEVDTHLQTYDYDDFYTIYKETTDGKEVNGKETAADQITFAFKYRTETDNFDATTRYSAGDTIPSSIDTDNFENGWEQLLDYHDRPINIFGKQLSNAEQTNDPIYVVSNGYEYTRAGYYATTWTAYNSSFEKIGTILPSALIVSTKARMINNTLYPDGVAISADHPTMMQYDDANTQTVYDSLKNNYADRPVMITYEEAITNSNTSGTGKYYHAKLGEISTRSDGRWFYSYMNEEINANLRIDYGDEDYGDNVDRWSHDTFKSGTNTGSVTGATVHFTNTSSDTAEGPYELTPYHDTADYSDTIYSNFNHYYKFEATEGAGYIFMGWYMERDGIQTAVTPDNVKQLTGKSQMTSNATFVARYVKNPAGHLTINHTMADGSTGTGTTYIKVEKSQDGENWENITDFVRQDSYSINDTDVMSYNSGYTLRVTLKTVTAADTSFERFSAATGDDDHSSEYFSTTVTTSTTTNTNDTSTTTFEIPVDDLFELSDGFPAQKAGYDTFTYYSHTVKKPELIINHNIDPTSDGTAEGTTYVKVEVTDSGKTDIYATYDDGEGGYVENGNIVIPSQYFNSTGNYWLKVYLKTDMEGFTQFSQFSLLNTVLTNGPGTHGEEITIGDANNKRTKTATVIFPISMLFSGGEPQATELPYLSKLIVPDYKYKFTYTVPAYVDKTDTITYTAYDSFAPEELRQYMTLTNGDLAFQDDTKKKTFVCSKAPYEDNFQKKLNFYEQFDTTSREYTSGDYTLCFDLSITEAQQQTLDVSINFPYETQTGANKFLYQVTDDRVYSADSESKPITGVYGRDWITLNGVRNKSISGTPEFIKAPLIIYDDNNTRSDTTDDTPMYFKYWQVSTTATAKYASREYTRCYDYEFNLSIFQDCIITPVYGTDSFEDIDMPAPPTTYNGYTRFDPDVNRNTYKDDNGVSITFLENSRNQYNNGGAYDTAPTNNKGAADRIYSDFLLTFDNDPTVKLQDLDAGTKQAGLIIQPVAYLEQDENEEYIVNPDSYYEATAKYAGKTAAQIKTCIESGNFSGLVKSQFDVTKLDNKNRIQYYYAFDNALPKAAGATPDDDGIIRVGRTYNNQKIVYKAFAYIGDGDGTGNLTNVVVSSKPIYFTFYTDATIAPGYYVPDTSGN